MLLSSTSETSVPLGLHKILDSDSKIIISLIIIHRIFSFLNASSEKLLKLGNTRVIFPNFQKRAFCKNNHSSLHLSRNYARIFVLGHYLFLEAHNFPLSENCSLHRTDNVRGQIFEHIFAPKGGYCLSILVLLTSNTVFAHYNTNTWTNEGEIS